MFENNIPNKYIRETDKKKMPTNFAPIAKYFLLPSNVSISFFGDDNRLGFEKYADTIDESAQLTAQEPQKTRFAYQTGMNQGQDLHFPQAYFHNPASNSKFGR